jgi:protein dithiol:quinone oxidoreductase
MCMAFMKVLGARILNLVIFIVTTFLILTALFMQHLLGLEPCYLCIVQRVFVIITGSLALIAFIHNPQRTGHRLYAFGIVTSSFAGGAFALRQLWLQGLPEDKIPACGPPVEYLVDAFPMIQVLPILLRGDGNCAQVQWTLLGISIPGYTLLAFLCLAALGVWQLIRKI